MDGGHKEQDLPVEATEDSTGRVRVRIRTLSSRNIEANDGRRGFSSGNRNLVCGIVVRARGVLRSPFRLQD